MFQLALGEEGALRGEGLDIADVGRAFLAVGQDDVLAAKQRQVGAVGAVSLDVVGHLQIVLEAHLIVVVAMAGGGVDKACARVIGDVITGEHGDGVVPFAMAILDACVGVGAGDAGQIICRNRTKTAEHLWPSQFGLSEHSLGQRVGQDHAMSDGGDAFRRAPDDFIKAVTDAGAKTDRAVLRDRPRSGRPDHHIGVGAGEQRVTCRNHRKPHPNLMRGVVVIFHLGLGQCGLFDRRPHHGLRPLIQRAVHHEFHELIRDHRLGVVVHCQVGVGPVAGDAEAFELVALHVDPAKGEGATFAAEIHHVNVVFVQAFGAVLLLDLPFNRQAVAIPARHIAGVFAHHLLAADNHVFQHFIQRVADVQMAVGVRGSVVQGKGHPSRFLTQTMIDADLFPMGQPVRFAGRQACAHREIGFGQKHSVAVVGCSGRRIGAHRMRSLIGMGGARIGAGQRHPGGWVSAPGP